MIPEISLHSRLLTRTRLIVFVVIVCALLAALAVSVRGWWGGTLEAEEKELVAGQGQPSGRFPIVLLNLTRFGFEPSRITVPAGRCLLAIRNRSGLESIDLQLSREAGDRLISERHQQGKRHWERQVVLTPGNYVLTEANHPRWSLRITVRPPGQ